MVVIRKESKRIVHSILIIFCSFVSVVGYAEAVSLSKLGTEAQEVDMKEPLNVEKVPKEKIHKDKTDSDELCVGEAFNGLMSWFAEQFDMINEKYLSKSDKKSDVEPRQDSVLLKDEPKTEAIKPLNLTIPEVAYAGAGTMKLDTGIKSTLPDLFAEQEKSNIKEKPSASVGGRLLMDEAELDGMEEYRIGNMRDAVRGAEVSLEFKTN